MFTPPRDIEFSPWVPWQDRRTLQLNDQPSLGVYIWGHFHSTPTSKVEYPDLPIELIYVGESKNLYTRLCSGSAHHRLTHYRATYPLDSTLQHLYLAVFRIEPYVKGDQRCRALRAYTRYVEDRLYWEYVLKFGKKKDYVLVMLFVKYVSDKYAGVPYAPITIPKGASFKDMAALKGKSDIGDQINKKILGPLAAANKLS